MKTKSPIIIAFARSYKMRTLKHFYVNKFYMVHTINLTNVQNLAHVPCVFVSKRVESLAVNSPGKQFAGSHLY